ncbi:hypothetical protein [Streptomyces sp. NBC_01314]|uniref:hypothetical protein n=1 Tax=Streptomyces sp. NBC_01314 TaxID=2903821 RepID=UPI00308914FB|nr:hypothetical protein OG622_18190 [Streptomyces sp. NBC_01314]
MLDFTVRALTWVLSVCMLSPRGRHRAESVPAPPAPATNVTASPRPPRSTERLGGSPNATARPRTSTLTHASTFTLEERHRRRATRGLRERRRALYLASLGFDTEPPVFVRAQGLAGHAVAAR